MLRFFPALLLVFMVSPAVAQTPVDDAFVVQFADSSRIWVDGSSNRSDWTVFAPEWSVEMAEVDGAPSGLSVTVDVASMEGGTSTIMDRLMHRTFNAATHPEILFVSSSIAPLASDSLLVTGDLTMAGQTQRVDVRVHADSSASTYVVWSGQKALKMTDYGMKPPTAMFGALHTADDVLVNFRMISPLHRPQPQSPRP